MKLQQLVISTLAFQIAACRHCLELCEQAGNKHGAKRHRERLAELSHRLACFLGQ